MSPASFWVVLKSKRHVLINIFLGLLIFGVGWQLGRAMSPYYTAHPIVFEDRECTTCEAREQSPAHVSGDIQELSTLQQNGVKSQQSKSAVAGIKNNSSQAATDQGVKETAPSDEGTGGGGGQQKTYVGSINSTKYHHTNCASWKQIKEENQIWFSSTEEAEAAGYTPTKCTVDILSR